MQLDGIAPIQLSVKDVARSKEFYRPLLDLLEIQVLIDSDGFPAEGDPEGFGIQSLPWGRSARRTPPSPRFFDPGVCSRFGWAISS